MTDNTELKRLAEACGDLNWCAIQENWCEWAIRDDHGYIATMRTKSAKHTGPCPDRESKAKFLSAVTPAAVLALIAENEAMAEFKAHMVSLREASGFDSWAAVLVDLDRLKAENEALREEVALDDKLIADRDRLLNMFECPDHGQCIPYAMEQVEALRKDADKWQIVERAMTQLQSDEQGAAIWSACSRILISVAGKLNSAHSTVMEEGVTFNGVEAGDWRVTVERIDAALGQGEQS